MLSKLKMLFKTWACVAGAFALLATSGCGGGGGGGSDPPPSIAQQPAALTVTAPQSATFNVTASSPLPLSYQWLRNGSAVAGATAASYTTPATSDTDSGAVYSVQVSNNAGSVTSATAVLTVLTRPELSTAPQSTAGLDGAPLTLTATARGSAPLSFQWQRNGVDIAGATAASYTIAALAPAGSGARYAVVVSNAAGSVTSSSAVVTVNPAPATLTQQLSAATRSEGQSAVFTVVVAGTQPITYQWLLNGADIPGATSASYTTPVLGLANSGDLYSVRITNPAGTVTSNAAALTVATVPQPPVISAGPAARNVVVGEAATFSVAATGDPTPSIQWQVSSDSGTTWSAIAGATTTSYSTQGLSLADSGKLFRVELNNLSGTAISNSALLSVTAATTPIDPPTFGVSLLTDTGISSNQCITGAGRIPQSCASAAAQTFSRFQDGMLGLDVTSPSNSDGKLGFSYTKIDSTGQSLPATETVWSCVRDNVTKLVWQTHDMASTRTLTSGFKNFQNLDNGAVGDASKQVSDMNAAAFCGFTDWRIPSAPEFQSIVNYGSADRASVDNIFFVGQGITRNYAFWTSTTPSGVADRNDYGLIGVASLEPDFPIIGHQSRAALNRLLLVRGQASSGSRFTLQSNGSEVKDLHTGLTWQRCSLGQTWNGTNCAGLANRYTLDQAFAASNLQTGWRIPNIKELFSIIDYNNTGIAIDERFFPGTEPALYWSATPSIDNIGTGHFWTVSFQIGGAGHAPTFNHNVYNLRLVK